MPNMYVKISQSCCEKYLLSRSCYRFKKVPAILSGTTLPGLVTRVWDPGPVTGDEIIRCQGRVNLAACNLTYI